MKKSSLFISTILTVFVLAILAGTVTAYRSLTNLGVQAQQPAPVTEVVQNQISPEQAAQLAAQYWGRNDLYSVESTSVKGMDAYKVTFSTGDVVFVSPAGQVIGAFAAPRASSNQASIFPSHPAQQSQPGFSFSDDDHGGDDD